MTTVRLNESAIRAYASSTEAVRLLTEVGEKIADDARAAAPRRTGALAESIDYEIGHDSKGAYVRVAWSKDQFYGIFAELGTSKESARPFLRPAALKHRSL